MAVGEGDIAEAIAEAIQWLAGEIPIGSTGPGIGFERGKLIDGIVEGYRESAGWVVVAGEGLGNGGSSLLSRIPGFQNGSGMLFRPRDGKCATVHQYHHQRLPRCSDGLQQILLQLGQVDFGSV